MAILDMVDGVESAFNWTGPGEHEVHSYVAHPSKFLRTFVVPYSQPNQTKLARNEV